MEDYPKNLAEFDRRFATERRAGTICFGCAGRTVSAAPPVGTKGWPVRRILVQCGRCGGQTSVTAGTIFQGTRMPLTQWFRAMWLVTSQKTGASALGLQQILGLGSYKTAWTWLHKLRRAMVRPGRDRLSGRVEVDETYIGSREKGVRGRQIQAKAMIVVAAQEDGKGIGRIRMKRIRNASAESLVPFVEESIEAGSVVHTDAWLGYEPLNKIGYVHEVSFLKGNTKSPSDLMPRVHRVVSLLKRWLMGTHQGAVSQEHLDYYLDEFTFRFNRRKSGSRGKLFFRLAQQAVALKPAPYKLIVKHGQDSPHDHNREGLPESSI